MLPSKAIPPVGVNRKRAFSICLRLLTGKFAPLRRQSFSFGRDGMSDAGHDVSGICRRCRMTA